MDPLATLQRLGQGRLMEELAEALALTAAEVVATGKPGTVTLTLKVSNHGVGDVMVAVEEKLDRKAPTKDARGAFFFAWDGELHKNDPRQPQMDFRTVTDRETGEIREIPADQPTVREAAS